jgi:metal-sulfur cluster biosynthetic enzyme
MRADVVGGWPPGDDGAALRERLAQVLDPELDEPILDLGFVRSMRIDAGHVHVALRLPTSRFARNFAYLMAEDVRRALLGLAGIDAATVGLGDHRAAAEIEAVVNAGRPFAEAFPGEGGGDPVALRRNFLRKGFLVRQERQSRELRALGCEPPVICALRLGEASTRDDKIVIQQTGAAPVAGGSTGSCSATSSGAPGSASTVCRSSSTSAAGLFPQNGSASIAKWLALCGSRSRPTASSAAPCRACPAYPGEEAMYRHNGRDIFVVDGHMHFWDASPENWRNKCGESWKKCFYAYHSALSPAEAAWSFDKFCRYGEAALVDNLFRAGYVDMAILNSTYLYEFYNNGFNSYLQNNVVKARYPDRFLLCGSFELPEDLQPMAALRGSAAWRRDVRRNDHRVSGKDASLRRLRLLPAAAARQWPQTSTAIGSNRE